MASSASCRVILEGSTSPLPSAVGGDSGRPLSSGRWPVKGGRGSEGGATVGIKKSRVDWSMEGIVLYTSVVIRMEVSSVVVVEELRSADKASVKWSLAGLLGLLSPFLGRTATSICKKSQRIE